MLLIEFEVFFISPYLKPVFSTTLLKSASVFLPSLGTLSIPSPFYHDTEIDAFEPNSSLKALANFF